MRHPTPVGARRCLARPRHRRGKHPWHASTTPPIHPAPCPSPHPVIAGPAGPAGQAAPDPYRTARYHRIMAPKSPIGDAAPHPCRGEALPRPPAPWPRRSRVADTSRTTRSADQPSGPLHDRPAVNGRAQSPSRLKPADPNGACTQPIDPGAWAPHSPLQGALGFSPGLQPRAHSWRPPPLGSPSVPRRRCHSPALAGRRVRHRLTLQGGGCTAEPWRAGALPEMPAQPVSARGAASPAAPPARQCIVADTPRTTRSADQQSSCIHDRPAVNGRAQSPSRLKPADPIGACTQPIDSGAWAPHSPLQGASGFSPGLQPRADGWRPPPP
jgi:hypothetical protein